MLNLPVVILCFFANPGQLTTREQMSRIDSERLRERLLCFVDLSRFSKDNSILRPTRCKSRRMLQGLTKRRDRVFDSSQRMPRQPSYPPRISIRRIGSDDLTNNFQGFLVTICLSKFPRFVKLLLYPHGHGTSAIYSSM